jgi:uncharacterized protein
MSTPHTAAPPMPKAAQPEIDEAEVLRQMVDIIVREADPESIILFGSRARGDARSDSDVDLLIIEREPFGPGRSRIQKAARLYRALADMPVSKDLLLYSRADAERWRGTLNHVVARAYREGRVLYGEA